jgi:hypothetical protein
MNKQQVKIYDKILDKYDLPYDNTFIQHRNLKEFRYFFIERINPNHRILLFGKFKKDYVRNKDKNRIIKVGEILLYSAFMVIPVDNVILNFELKIMSLLCITKTLYELCLNDGIPRFYLYVDRNRGQYRKWKNIICGKMC